MHSPGKRLSSAVVTLVIVSPALLAFSGCAGSNCDSNFSTPQTSDDCGTGTGGGVGGRVGSGGPAAGARGSERGGFGAFGRSFSGGS